MLEKGAGLGPHASRLAPHFSRDMPPAPPPLAVALLMSPEELCTIIKTQASAKPEQPTSLGPVGDRERGVGSTGPYELPENYGLWLTKRFRILSVI